MTDVQCSECLPSAQRRQQRIANGFSMAATRYDTGAELQGAVADDLLARLPALERVSSLVDIGCGTGYLVSRLAERHGGLSIGVDIAPGMLHEARRQSADRPIRWLVGSAEQLPLAAESVDLMVSSLAVQWCDSLAGFLNQAVRVLRTGGWLGFTTLCEGTLDELQAARQQTDGVRHANTFISETELIELLDGPDWRLQELTLTTRKTHHATPQDALRALKRIGAATLTDSAHARRGLTGRRRLDALTQALETWREPAGIPTRYRVATVILQRAESSHAS
ncbi:methyltransferase domain-containing protein [Salinicola halophyticus]|uniref:methyltransferase domain-containing protein n=1 Tax=Salinicola halophyticus TaxID=1808881 RepID=UPI003F44EFFC